jgi:ParB family chromosome partitioning protein
MARRFPSRQALMNEIDRLKAQGYTNGEIGKKLDIDQTLVAGFIALKNAGEERLLDAAINGKIPLSVAMDIAKTNGAETQRELLKAYESKQLNGVSIRVVKRLMDQRRFVGKQRGSQGTAPQQRLTSAESLVNAYRRESRRQKLMIKKAKLCDAKLVFIVTAFNKLLADENFVNLLRAESLSEMPKYLWDKLGTKHNEAT